MPKPIRLWAALLAAFAAHAAAPRAAAAEANPADVKAVAVYPTKVSLVGGDDAVQLIVTGTLGDGRLVDLTPDAKYTVADGKTGAALSGGRVVPRANGTSEIVVAFGNQSARVPLGVTSVGENLPLNFTNQVVPVFTKLG